MLCLMMLRDVRFMKDDKSLTKIICPFKSVFGSDLFVKLLGDI